MEGQTAGVKLVPDTIRIPEKHLRYTWMCERIVFKKSNLSQNCRNASKTHLFAHTQTSFEIDLVKVLCRCDD